MMDGFATFFAVAAFLLVAYCVFLFWLGFQTGEIKVIWAKKRFAIYVSSETVGEYTFFAFILFLNLHTLLGYVGR